MKKISKKTGITIFTALMVILGAIIILYRNPLADPQDEMIKKGIACVLIVAAIIAFIKLYDKITVLPKELYQNRRLIWKLAKSDFKKRYAGSYMGAFWALVQPVVTIAMYYVVFEVIFPQRQGMATGGVETVPYVLFLVAGMVPWFYFSEALTSAMMALLEYNYLVKKVVFKISVLPIIKIIAATFIHVFFVLIALIIACFYGYYPSLYTLQVFYYSACMFIFVLAISYTTCSVVIFFRDLQSIVNIFLQVGMWATPVLWNINGYDDKIQMIVKINPLVYIVEGYRSAIYGKQWFWEDFYSTVYFWVITVVLFIIGAVIFKKLKVHFADIM
ncbi:MAG: ABC transporter permease [Lachnospiraceae bacterium]|nr:ABC transporter permease [Lachnospiraceae bacterium]